ncbi:flagellar hook-length control protein FliK [Cryptosporangium arvum]|uniref:Flagellar hook-length control protein n=1 Tax=Cryptosporangium arvum DSM 44712 TaxID=927661 RepID=A0A010ZUT6_9ACTN|nr:flagellar hook-length control protein FliK [Cryptosporangium arvum]EXG80972.1 flagellar hook-length control protein [Cryptosporangium arvum DSM 44712]
MSISPLPASQSTMSLMAATNTTPARPAGEMGSDNGPRQGQDDDERFVSALQAASGSKGADDTTISEQDSSEGPKTKQKPSKAPEEDSGRRAVLNQAWHTTMTGMPPSDTAGALALPAALLAHGQLALGSGATGDIGADAPPVAVIGIGVVTEGEGGIATGPVLNPATLGLNAKGSPTFTGLAGLRGLAGPDVPGVAPPDGGSPSTRAFGLPELTVVGAAEARPAVEAAITANADSAAAAASLAEVDLAAFTGALGEAGALGDGLGAAPAPGAGIPGAGAPGAGGPGAGGPSAGGPSAGGPGAGGPSAGGPGAAPPGAGATGEAAGLGQGIDLSGLAGLEAGGGPPVVTKSGRQLSPAELAATQATAAQNAAAQVAAVQATAAQLDQFLAADPVLTAAPVPAPGGPIPAPIDLPGYVPGALGVGPGTTGDAGTGSGTEGGREEGFTDALAAADAPAAPDATAFTPLHTPDVSQPQQLDLTGANAPDQAPPPPPAAQVAEQIIPLRTQGDGVHRIAMELRPDDLGTISVVAEIRNGQVHLHFGGANEMTRETLRAALPELRQQLEDAGFSGAAFDFGDSPAGQQNRQFAATGQGPGGQPGRNGQPGDPGAETGRPAAPRPGGYPEPTPTGAGRHALDLQV